MLLKAKYVFPVSDVPIENGAVLVEGNIIKEVGRCSDLRIHHPHEEVMDLGQAALIPGFVNLHTRLERTLLRGIVADEPYAKWLYTTMKLRRRLNVQDRADSCMLGCLEALRCGTTTIADIAEGSGSLKAASETGIRAVVFRETVAVDGQRIGFAINQAKREIAGWQDSVASDRVRVGITPGQTFDTHPKIFREIATLSRDMNIPLTLHLAGSIEEQEFIERGKSVYHMHDPGVVESEYAEIAPWLPFGVSPVKYALNWGAFESDDVSVIHGIHVSDDDINILKSHRVGICSCPGSEAQLGMGAAPLVEYLKAGLNVGFGTDSPAATEACDMLNEMRFSMLLNRAITTRNYIRSSTVLRLGTLGGAKVLGLDDKIGTLEAGKIADIVAVSLARTNQILEMNPTSALVNRCVGADVLMTMVDGKILYDHGEYKTNIDLEVLRNRLRVARDKVSKPL